MAIQRSMPQDRVAWLEVPAFRHHRASISTSEPSEQRAPGRVMQSGTPQAGEGLGPLRSDNPTAPALERSVRYTEKLPLSSPRVDDQ
jgi:hypothetical protein